MARPLRVEFPGGLYHVTARGNAREPIFADDADHEGFLRVLGSVVARYHVLCHAYCLMPNHFHLLLETPEGNLSRAMRHLNGVYSQRFNRRHARPGHVLEGRFHARVVDRAAYLRAVCRYIVLNPVRAGLVAHPREWRWSSYRAAAGETPVPAFLTVDWVLALGDVSTRAAAERRYRQFVEAGLTEVVVASDRGSMGLVVGDPAASGLVRASVERAARLTEIPRAQRFALRPPLAAVFAGAESREERNARCASAVHEHGYSIAEIAGFLGLHYSTVSRALSRGREAPAAPEMLEFKT